MTISRIWRGLAAGLVGVVLAVGMLGAPAVAEPVGPAAPTVTGDVYKENEVGGGVGQTGAFTFASSADVTRYMWGFSDPPATVAVPAVTGGSVTVRWTPATAGPETLYVQAVNAEGATSERAVYQFIVAEPAIHAARWLLDEPATATSLADSSGNGHAAVLDRGVLGVAGRIPGGGTVGRFDGKAGGGATADTVVDTSGSFSVSAWVRVTDTSTWRTAVSQDGAHTAGFQLQYARSCGCWRFLIPDADRVNPGFRAARSGRATAGVWTHLVGVYDSATGTARIYVNGTMAGTATGTAAPWKATGPLTIGRSRWNDRATDFWAGDLADVQVWNRVLFDDEIIEMTDPLQVGRVGEWHMDSVGPGPEFDSSGYSHDLTFFGGAEIPPSGAGQTGTGLRLNGTAAYVATDGPVVNTDQSFTVSAWARLSDGSAAHTVLAQHGTAEDAFALRYADGHWVFQARTADTATSGHVNAVSKAPATLNTWVHLVGVHDAGARKILLYVNGELAATTTFRKAWNAAGALTLGRGTHTGTATDFWGGDLDEVRVYAGVVTDVTRIP